jgi:mobilome CxxCx(11)CxxC protein
MPTKPPPSLLKTCQDKAFHAYGTSQIFERRARRYGRGRTVITYFGIVVPLLVGATATAFGISSAWFPALLYAAGLLGIAQLAISVWSIVARWDERYGQAVDAARSNTRLFNLWSKLETTQPADLERRVEDALLADQDQEQKDIGCGITDEEKRFAMHISLFYFRKVCPTCKSVPASRKPTDCDMCGNY